MTHFLEILLPYLPQIGYWIALQVAAGLVSATMGHKTQIEAFVAKHPNWTALIKICRSFGIDPTLFLEALRVWLTARAARVAAKIAAGLLVVLCIGCALARYPTPQELAVLLANTTDKALSIYILDTPESEMPIAADSLILADERMIELARLGGSACLVVSDARLIAKAIKCAECNAIAEQIAGAAQCPR
jgi:hypothetical protein